MSATDDAAQRMEALEVHAAFQAKTIEELDEVVREFAMRVERLDRELREMRAQLEAAGTIGPRVVVAADPDETDDVG